MPNWRPSYVSRHGEQHRPGFTDVPEQVLDACMKQKMFPEMMESLAAVDGDPIKASLDLVDNSNLYLGIFAHRYGYVPAGYEISITEIEYNHAMNANFGRFS